MNPFRLYLSQLSFLLGIALIVLSARPVLGQTTAPIKASILGQSLLPVPSYAPLDSLEVRLDRIVYPVGSGISVAVATGQRTLPSEAQQVYLVAPSSKDLEIVLLKKTTDPNVYTTERPLPIAQASAGVATPRDGRLTLQPNEIFVAYFTTDPRGKNARVVTDFGLLEDRTFKAAPVKVRPDLAMTVDEKKIPPGGKAIGTVVTQGGLPVQIPCDELVIYPLNGRQLDQFLRQTQGRVVMTARTAKGTKQESNAYLVRVNTDKADVEHLPQMRALFGEKDVLYGSSPDVLKLFALAMMYRLDGYAVGVNPRLQFMAAPRTEDALYDGSTPLDAMSSSTLRNPALFADDLFGVRRAWTYLALFERDTQRIPVAFVDMGFAPNWDYRDYSPTNPNAIRQRDLDGGTSSAVGPPTVGNSMFGAPSWHGNGVVTTAGGVLNNGWGSVGTGGQVVVPMLYKVGLRSYAFEMGNAMRLATDDGAAVINISAGYPCAAVSNVGVSFGICDDAGRVALCSALTAVLQAAAVTTCATFGWIPFAGPVICAAATTAATTGSIACFSLDALLDIVGTRGPMEDGVAYAKSRGVTVVSVAGNGLGRETLGQLCDVIQCGDSDAGRWQFIPCVIPDVICVGAADSRVSQGYRNLEFFGAPVAVWAPVGDIFYGPPNLNRAVGPEQQVPQPYGFAGTSAAAPYISGVIAMMIAASPSLNPSTSTSRTTIVDRIRDLLARTASVPPRIPPDPQRRNLVDAYAAVAAAARADNSILDLAAAGFVESMGFEEATPDASDGPATGQSVMAERGGSFRGTILSLPVGPGTGGTTFNDVDWFTWSTPTTPGTYTSARVRLEYPRGFGRLVMNGEGGTDCGGTTLVDCRQFTIPDRSSNSRVDFMLGAGSARDDNVYRVTFTPATRIPPPVGAPTVTITVPGDDTPAEDPAFQYDGEARSGLWYKDVGLEGRASDASGRPLSGTSLVWKTNRTDIPLQSEVLGTGTAIRVRLYGNRRPDVWHEISLTATDNQGHSATATRRICIWGVE